MCQHACPLDKPPKKKRERKHASPYRYVRKVKGRGYQCRPWLHGIGSLNLGCFLSEWEAGRTAREFVKRHAPGTHLCDVIAGLRHEGYVPTHVRMKFVYDLPGGAGFGARVKKRGQWVELPGPYQTEREAFEAMRDRLSGLMPTPGQSRVLVSKWVACQRLGINSRAFDQFWDGVFTDPRVAAKCESTRRVVFRRELDAALGAGGGCSDHARGAVALFRIGVGRV